MAITLGCVTFDDGIDRPLEPRFPDGIMYVVVESYRQAFWGVDLGGYLLMFDHEGRSRCGWFRALSVQNPDAVYGIQPGRMFDATDRPWPRRFEEMVKWRCARAEIPIERLPN